MNDLINTNKRLKTAHDNQERDYDAHIKKLDDSESVLTKRMDELNEKKREVAKDFGNLEAGDDDLVEINAGGKVIAAKRSTLTQLEGTRLEALFSGRWDKKLQRDGNGRIFLDVNPKCFQAIVDYLNELTISSEDNPPDFPCVDDEHKHILQLHLELFGLMGQKSMVFPDSNIVKDDETKAKQLHDWLKEDESHGELHLLYRSTRDGLDESTFHSKCNSKGSTLTIIETTGGVVVGGYSNTPWASNDEFAVANKAFLFALSSRGIASPCKMKLKNPNDTYAIFNSSSYGPLFGCGYDLKVQGHNVHLSIGFSYESGPSLLARSTMEHTIKEMEVFQVVGNSQMQSSTKSKKKAHLITSKVEPITRFTNDINDALNAKQECLFQARLEMNHLEESFKDEEAFINNFACGDIKDVVVLNVSGTMMVTKRATLCVAEESVLAQQFDDNKWTEQGCNNLHVREWTPKDVTSWVGKIDGISNEVSDIFKENEITGCELLALNMDGLKMIGIERAGTLCILLKEIKKLEQSTQDVATLIEHGPYCFGKILDYLRLKHLHSQGLVDEPSLPTVCETQKSRFEKVVKYYFPGDSSKFILGCSMPRGGSGVGVHIRGLGGGSALNDAVLQAIKTMGAFNDAGVHVNQITEVVTPQGYSAGDIKMAINNLSNEGHIYSTVDEYNYQYAE